MTAVSLTVNGKTLAGSIEPRTSLADFVRDTANLTGTHLGCEHGVCGACTILIDGVPARSCITFAAACDGAAVTTIEGLDGDDIAVELRAAFSREHALQCGYCTPGMMIAARDLVLRAADADEHAIRHAMSGNLCRCTGYVGIVKAVSSVIAARRARGIAPLAGAGRTALGPAGARVGTMAADALRRVSPPSARPAAPAAIRVEKDFTPQGTVEKSFTVAYPRDRVWAFFADTPAVARCLPGVTLAASSDREATGKIKVKAGPIVADFGGVAEIARDPSAWSGTIVGTGADGRSRSTARGRVAYRLTETEAGTTRVDVSIGYALTGTLAQFSRSRLIADIVDRLTVAFVANLEAALSGKEGAVPAAELDAGGLLFSAVFARIGGWFRSLFGR
jgi:carbon-monoxide dehydrogenase small subunit